LLKKKHIAILLTCAREPLSCADPDATWASGSIPLSEDQQSDGGSGS